MCQTFRLEVSEVKRVAKDCVGGLDPRIYDWRSSRSKWFPLFDKNQSGTRLIHFDTEQSGFASRRKKRTQGLRPLMRSCEDISTL